MIVMFVLLPVPKSFAVTFTIPLASTSKVTSIWGTPLGAGGISIDTLAKDVQPVVAKIYQQAQGAAGQGGNPEGGDGDTEFRQH